MDWPEEKKADYCADWQRQLAREVGPEHMLRGLAVTLVARRFDRDDALFQLSDGRVADVHLTWAKGEENDPTWPGTVIFGSLEEWAAESMVEQHRQWAAE